MHDELLARARRLEVFASQDPANATLLHDLAQTYHQAGEHERALTTLDRLPPEQQPSAQPLRGQLLLAAGRWQEAAQLFEDSLKTASDSAALWFNLGYALWAQGDSGQRPVQCLARAAQLDGQNPRVRRYLALAQEAAGDLPAALTTLSQAVQADVADSELFILQSQLELDAANVPAAQAAAERAIAAKPSAAPAWQAKGQAALFALDAQAAAKALRQSLDLDATDADTHALLAQASLMLGRPHQARRLIEALAARNAADASAMCILGWACASEDDVAAARAAFEQAVALDSLSADALSGLSCVLLAGGEHERAQATVARALALEPDNAIAQLVKIQCDATLRGAPADKSAIDAVLASMPLGPLNVSLGGALAMPQIQASAQKLSRRARRVTKPAAVPPTSPR